MKTIAFLCTILSTMFVTHNSVSLQAEQNDTEDAYISTETEKGKLTINYEGNTSFTTEVSTDDLLYYVNQTTTYKENIIVYGFTINRPLREHKAFILFLNLEGQVLRHDIFDDADLLEFVNHYILDDNLILRMRESEGSDDERNSTTEEIRNHFIRYDDTLTTFQKESIDSVLKVIDESEDKLLMKPTYDVPYSFGIDAELNLYEPNIIYGAKDKDTFTGSVSLFTLNEATLDGEVVSHHFDITYPGYHHIKTSTNDITITLHPENTTIEENQTYDAPLTLEGIKGRLILNGRVIAQGETIIDPGNYSLSIEGTNGYEKRLNFVVLSSVSGVYNNHIYDTKRTLSFNGVGYLNNTYIETGYTVNKPGLYTLDILGENDYRETLQFEIRSIENETSKNTLLYFEIGLLATIVITTTVLVVKYKLKA